MKCLWYYLQIYLEEVEPDVVTVTPAVSLEHVERERQRRNSAIIVEEVGSTRISSVPLYIVLGERAVGFHSLPLIQACYVTFVPAL